METTLLEADRLLPVVIVPLFLVVVVSAALPLVVTRELTWEVRVVVMVGKLRCIVARCTLVALVTKALLQVTTRRLWGIETFWCSVLRNVMDVIRLDLMTVLILEHSLKTVWVAVLRV